MKLTKPVECRKAVPEDMGEIMLIVRQARNYLKKHRVDQWQGEYPAEANFLPDINAGRCLVMTYGGEVAGFFLSRRGARAGLRRHNRRPLARRGQILHAAPRGSGRRIPRNGNEPKAHGSS